jgi:hypothetical protein
VALFVGACSFDATGVGAGGGGGDDDDTTPDAAPPPVGQPDAAPPVDPPDPPGIVRARVAPPGIAMDANLAEWGGALWYEVDIGNSPHKLVWGPGYQSSFNARFALLHDAQYIYVAILVEDDVAASGGGQLFEDDGIALYLDAQHDASGPFGWDDHEIIVNHLGTWQDYAPAAAAVDLTGDLATTATGFTLEFRLAKGSLGATLGGELGFDLALIDNDGLGTAGADSYGLWYVSGRPACPSCCAGTPEAWCDTTLFGTVVLD